MNKCYSRINWENYPSTATAVNATNLNKIDFSVNELDNRVINLDTTKLSLATAYTMVKSISYNESTGVFTVTYLNGTTSTLDTKLEKLAVNFEYDSANERLVITLSDGTKQYVDMKSLITQYDFVDSDRIDFTVGSDGKVSADIKDGSITGDKLQPNYLADCTTAKNQAESASSSAQTFSESAETSATNAKASENSAKTSETNAKISESNANASASASSVSELNAKASETNAKTSETNAKASETKAKTSETNAKTSETNALSSANNASEKAEESTLQANKSLQYAEESKYYMEQASSIAGGDFATRAEFAVLIENVENIAGVQEETLVIRTQIYDEYVLDGGDASNVG